MDGDESELRHSQVEIGGSALHVVQAGDPAGPAVLFLHGWPECWSAWGQVMSIAAQDVHAVAIDLPGVGGSTGDPTDGTTLALARLVHRLVEELSLSDLTLVGQDMGGMITYAYLREHPDLARAVIMDVAVPGVDPWDKVLSNPHIWHFAFHSITGLPERMVQGRQRDYFDFFYDVLSADASRIGAETREGYAAAYASDAQLTAGFSWYRGFAQDTEHNRAVAEAQPEVTTPLLYIRGAAEGGDLADYAAGFRSAGLSAVTTARIADAGHFSMEEQPAAVWSAILEHLSR